MRGRIKKQIVSILLLCATYAIDSYLGLNNDPYVIISTMAAIAITGGAVALGGGILGGIQARQGRKQMDRAQDALNNLQYPMMQRPGQVGQAENIAASLYNQGISPEMLQMIQAAQGAYNQGVSPEMQAMMNFAQGQFQQGMSPEMAEMISGARAAYSQGMTPEQKKAIELAQKTYNQGAGPVRVGPAYDIARTQQAYNQAAGLGNVSRGATSTQDMMAALATANQQGLSASNELAAQEAQAYQGERARLQGITENRRGEYLNQLGRGGEQRMALQGMLANALSAGGQQRDARAGAYLNALAAGGQQRDSRLGMLLETLAQGGKQRQDYAQMYLNQLGTSADWEKDLYVNNFLNPYLSQREQYMNQFNMGQGARQAGFNTIASGISAGGSIIGSGIGMSRGDVTTGGGVGTQ